VLLSDTWEWIPSSSLSLSLSLLFHQSFFPFHTDLLFYHHNCSSSSVMQSRSSRSSRTHWSSCNSHPLFCCLVWSSKQSLSPPFHSIPFPFFSPHHPLQLDSRSAQLGGSCSLIRLKPHAFPFVSSFIHSFILSFFSWVVQYSHFCSLKVVITHQKTKQKTAAVLRLCLFGIWGFKDFEFCTRRLSAVY